MRLSTRIGLFAVGGLALAAWACNMQPSTDQGPTQPSSEPMLNPEPGIPSGDTASRPTDRRSRRARGPQRVVDPRTPKPQPPVGPQAHKPAPLPKADKTVAIFHSGNVGGELDPCG